MSQTYVTALYHYPLKSCRGIALDEARVTPYGLEQDRHWMVVDSKGVFVSQRRLPAMALIEAQPTPQGLRLWAPDMPEYLATSQPNGPVLEVEIWGTRSIAQDAGEAAANWLSDYLGQTCRLAILGPRFQRPVDARYDHHETQLAFSDGFPFLLLSEASLEDLNTRLDTPLPMNRFRPNIVIGGCQAYAEDHWRTLRIGALLFQGVKPCSRCAITTIDQDKAQGGKEPLKTLARYRRGADGKVYFGQNLIHASKQGILRIGDPVTILNG